jgi:hypothetical protein
MITFGFLIMMRMGIRRKVESGRKIWAAKPELKSECKRVGVGGKSKNVKSEPQCVFSEFLRDFESFQQTSFNNRGESAGTSRTEGYDKRQNRVTKIGTTESLSTESLGTHPARNIVWES